MVRIPKDAPLQRETELLVGRVAGDSELLVWWRFRKDFGLSTAHLCAIAGEQSRSERLRLEVSNGWFAGSVW